MTAADPFEALLARAEAARGSGDIPAGMAAAEQAWTAAAGDAEQRRRAGMLLTHFQFRGGALPALVETGSEVLPLLRGAAQPAELFDLLRNVALAACDTGRFDVALPAAQEAQTLAMQLGDQPRLALAVNALGCCFERMGDPWQAERQMNEALEIARRSGDRHTVFVSLNNLTAVLIGMFHLLRDAGPGDEARAALQRALPMAREAHALAEPGSFFAVFADGNLGETLLHLGLIADARPLLDGALALAQQLGAQAQWARIGNSLGELELQDGDAGAAWTRLEALHAKAAGAALQMTQLRLHHALWRTARALQRPEQALQHLEAYLLLERQRALNQLRAQSALFVTRAEAERARHDSHRDQLTRLANRREVEQRWPQLLAGASTAGKPVAVAVIDVDRFKQINDGWGHAAGDAVLVALAGILRDNTRGAGDLVARVGGEEFLLVLPGTPPVRALETCERLRQRASDHDWAALAPGLAVTLSIGLTGSPPYDAQVLTGRADAALYRAKAEGRDRVVQV